jgi:hypothetical protein
VDVLVDPEPVELDEPDEEELEVPLEDPDEEVEEFVDEFVPVFDVPLDAFCVVFAEEEACVPVCAQPAPNSATPRIIASKLSLVLYVIPGPRCPRFSLVTGGWSSIQLSKWHTDSHVCAFRELLDGRTNFGHSEPVRLGSIFADLLRLRDFYFLTLVENVDAGAPGQVLNLVFRCSPSPSASDVACRQFFRVSPRQNRVTLLLRKCYPRTIAPTLKEPS